MILILIKHFNNQGLAGSTELLERWRLHTKVTSNRNTCTETGVVVVVDDDD